MFVRWRRGGTLTTADTLLVCSEVAREIRARFSVGGAGGAGGWVWTSTPSTWLMSPTLTKADAGPATARTAAVATAAAVIRRMLRRVRLMAGSWASATVGRSGRTALG